MYEFIEKVVDDYMTRAVRTVTGDRSLSELNDLFAKDDFNAYPVVDGASVVGIVTKLDFLKRFALSLASMVPRYADLMEQTVADAMTHDFIYVAATTKLTRVLQLMVEHRVRSIPVIGPAQSLLGIISREDVMRALRNSNTELKSPK